MPTPLRLMDFKFEMLSSSNYVKWARRMRDHLMMCGLGGVISRPAVPQSQANLVALAVIRSNVNDDQLTAIEGLSCAHETWKALHNAHAAVCQARRMHIRGQLASLRLASGEVIREYGRRALDIRSQLLDVGATCGDEELVDYILLGLPEEYRTIRTIVGDSNVSDLEQVLGRLARYQEQELSESPPGATPAVALAGQSRPRRGRKRDGQQKKPPRDDRHIVCFNCNQKGHRAANCKHRRHAASSAPTPEAHGRALVATALAAHVPPGSEAWIVDTGATHHMTGDASAISDLRDSPVKSIEFGGGDSVAVLGQGDRRVTSAVGGVSHAITLKDVLLLERMSFNLLSASTMTEKGVTMRVDASSCVVEDNGQPLIVAPLRDGLYQASLRPAAS